MWRASCSCPGLLVLALLLAAASAGCRQQEVETTHPVSNYPVVSIVHPERRTIDYAVDQPGFVDAFEQTSIFSKVSGFIEHFYVDIGQEVKKGDLLAEIFVPELDEDHQRKMAQVELDKKQVEQARQLVVVAESNVQTAIAQLAEGAGERRQVSGRRRPLGLRGQATDPDGAGERR